jgi:hypothetical protein
MGYTWIYISAFLASAKMASKMWQARDRRSNNPRQFAGSRAQAVNTCGWAMETLATPDHITHTLRITNLQRIIYKVGSRRDSIFARKCPASPPPAVDPGHTIAVAEQVI